jgi:hypothetical protein
MLRGEAEQNAADLLERYPEVRSLIETVDEPPPISRPSKVLLEEVHSTSRGKESLRPTPSESPHQPISSTLYSRANLRMWSSILEHDIVSDPYAYLNSIEKGHDYLERSTLYALQRWAGSPDSRVLWICERGSSSSLLYPAATTFISATVINSTLTLRLPILAFFCGWPYDSYAGEV